MNLATRRTAVALSAVAMIVLQGCAMNLIEFCEKLTMSTVPAVMLAVDADTDSFGGGVELTCPRIPGAVCVSPAVEFGKGSQSFGYDYEFETFAPAAKQAIIGGDGPDYTVLQGRVHARYPFALNEDTTLTVSPIVGPRFYRWSQDNCDFEGCDENLFVFDVGAGVQYGNFGLDVFTGINGPNFGARLKYAFVK